VSRTRVGVGLTGSANAKASPAIDTASLSNTARRLGSDAAAEWSRMLRLARRAWPLSWWAD